jgi:hypothetical protein
MHWRTTPLQLQLQLPLSPQLGGLNPRAAHRKPGPKPSQLLLHPPFECNTRDWPDQAGQQRRPHASG